MEHQVVLSDVNNDNVGADINNDANDYDAYNEDNENADEKDDDTYLQTRPISSGFPPPPTTICTKLGSR